MIDNCPSGALAYSLEEGGEIIEPELAKEIVVIPDGPLWVSGGIRLPAGMESPWRPETG
jgi:hypothetical protein